MSDQPDPLRCVWRPEPGRWPAQDCWNIFPTEKALMEHIEQYHPSRTEWDQPPVGFAEPAQETA